jgi:hypothetical protein
MDSWPTYHRTQQEFSNQKVKAKEAVWHYPLVEQGSLTALTLLEKNRLEWSFIVKDQSGSAYSI